MAFNLFSETNNTQDSNNQPLTEPLLTVNELANYLKVPKSWVYSRTRERGTDSIPRVSCGKYIRFRIQDVMQWLKKQNEAE